MAAAGAATELSCDISRLWPDICLIPGLFSKTHLRDCMAILFCWSNCTLVVLLLPELQAGLVRHEVLFERRKPIKTRVEKILCHTLYYPALILSQLCLARPQANRAVFYIFYFYVELIMPSLSHGQKYFTFLVKLSKGIILCFVLVQLKESAFLNQTFQNCCIASELRMPCSAGRTWLLVLLLAPHLIAAVPNTCSATDLRLSWKNVSEIFRINRFGGHAVQEDQLFNLVRRILCEIDGMIASVRAEVFKHVSHWLPIIASASCAFALVVSICITLCARCKCGRTAGPGHGGARQARGGGPQGFALPLFSWQGDGQQAGGQAQAANHDGVAHPAGGALGPVAPAGQAAVVGGAAGVGPDGPPPAQYGDPLPAHAAAGRRDSDCDDWLQERKVPDTRRTQSLPPLELGSDSDSDSESDAESSSCPSLTSSEHSGSSADSGFDLESADLATQAGAMDLATKFIRQLLPRPGRLYETKRVFDNREQCFNYEVNQVDCMSEFSDDEDENVGSAATSRQQTRRTLGESWFAMFDMDRIDIASNLRHKVPELAARMVRKLFPIPENLYEITRLYDEHLNMFRYHCAERKASELRTDPAALERSQNRLDVLTQMARNFLQRGDPFAPAACIKNRREDLAVLQSDFDMKKVTSNPSLHNEVAEILLRDSVVATTHQPSQMTATPVVSRSAVDNAVRTLPQVEMNSLTHAITAMFELKDEFVNNLECVVLSDKRQIVQKLLEAACIKDCPGMKCYVDNIQVCYAARYCTDWRGEINNSITHSEVQRMAEHRFEELQDLRELEDEHGHIPPLAGCSVHRDNGCGTGCRGRLVDYQPGDHIPVCPIDPMV